MYSCGHLPLRPRTDVAPLATAFPMSLKASNGAHATSLVVFYACSYALGWRCLEFYFHFILPSPKQRRLCKLNETLTIHSLVRGNRPGKPVQLQEYEIKYLCTKAREIFINQPILLELEAPIKICGASNVSVA
jgi:hypothetical protein